MLETMVLALALFAEPETKLNWKDIPSPEGHEPPLVARIFNLDETSAREGSELASALFGDRVKVAVAGGRLIVLASRPTIDFFTAILKEVAGAPSAEAPGEQRPEPEPVQPDPKVAATLRTAIGEALVKEGLTYKSFPMTQVRHYRESVELTQRVSLTPGALPSILRFVESVLEESPGTEVAQAKFERKVNKKKETGAAEDPWVGDFEFRNLEGSANAKDHPGPRFLEIYSSFRKTFEASGASAEILSMDFRFPGQGEKPLTNRPEPRALEHCEVLLIGSDAEDHLRLEKAFRDEASFLEAQASITQAPGGDRYRMHLVLKPKPAAEK